MECGLLAFCFVLNKCFCKVLISLQTVPSLQIIIRISHKMWKTLVLVKWHVKVMFFPTISLTISVSFWCFSVSAERKNSSSVWRKEFMWKRVHSEITRAPIIHLFINTNQSINKNHWLGSFNSCSPSYHTIWRLRNWRKQYVEFRNFYSIVIFSRTRLCR